MKLPLSKVKQAQYNLGSIYWRGKRAPKSFEKAKKFFLMAAEHGLPEAQFALGLCYFKGLKKSMSTSKKIDGINESVRWYTKASDQGHPGAQTNLAAHWGALHCYDDEIKLLQKAANQGLAEAQFCLGKRYQFGGVSFFDNKEILINIPEAIRWYKKAAKQGHKKAKKNLDKLLK